MYEDVQIDFGNLLLSLSDAMDLARPDLASHGLRTAFIAWELGRELGIGQTALGTLLAAGLFHDVGALSVEEKVSLVHDPAARTTPHCARGAALLERVSFLSGLAPVVRYHHRPWGDWPQGEDAPEVLLSQILLLADTVERKIDRDLFILHQNGTLRATIAELPMREIHPLVVDAFLAVSEREDFWLDLVSTRLYSLLLHRGPFASTSVGFAQLLELSELFRDIIDFRSRHTATHSSGVATGAMLIAEAFGMTESEVHLMQVAGNVHDLGKLAVPNSILDKPGGLTPEEFQVMKQHTYHTYAILNSIGGLRQIPEWAAFHHERLDGKGYPFRINRERLDTGARIMAVADVFTALAEDRPYRPAMENERIARILAQMAAEGKLDRQATRVLLDDLDNIRARAKEQQGEVRELYETRFAPLPDAE